MQAGQMRHRISIKVNTPTRDDFNDEVESWSTFVDTWAAIYPAGGREYRDAGQEQADVTHRVEIRHYPGITPTMEIEFDDAGGATRRLKIVSVNDVNERIIKTVMLCNEEIDE